MTLTPISALVRLLPRVEWLLSVADDHISWQRARCNQIDAAFVVHLIMLSR